MVEASPEARSQPSGNSPALNHVTLTPTDQIAEHVALLTEVQTLAAYIDRTRREIAALGVDRVVKSHVVTATDELDAIVMHTAAATTTILDACEVLDSASSTDSYYVTSAATARIYEACSFQDITGQRVGKVVQTLKSIEVRIADILRAFDNPARPESSPEEDARADSLLNGPQQPGEAMDQQAIDALLE